MSTDPYGPADQSAAWGTIVVVLLVVIAILLIGYFAWWGPANREDTTVIQTPRDRVIVPVPVPSPSPAPQPAPRGGDTNTSPGDVNIEVHPGG